VLDRFPVFDQGDECEFFELALENFAYGGPRETLRFHSGGAGIFRGRDQAVMLNAIP
jgi:hypothetical protein